jgi:type II secretory pathway pseudopilin PulG
MGYSTSDAQRIARLEAATRAARTIIEAAKAQGYLTVANRWSDGSCKDTDRAPDRQRRTDQPDP